MASITTLEITKYKTFLTLKNYIGIVKYAIRTILQLGNYKNITLKEFHTSAHFLKSYFGVK